MKTKINLLFNKGFKIVRTSVWGSVKPAKVEASHSYSCELKCVDLTNKPIIPKEVLI